MTAFEALLDLADKNPTLAADSGWAKAGQPVTDFMQSWGMTTGSYRMKVKAGEQPKLPPMFTETRQVYVRASLDPNVLKQLPDAVQQFLSAQLGDTGTIIAEVTTPSSGQAFSISSMGTGGVYVTNADVARLGLGERVATAAGRLRTLSTERGPTMGPKEAIPILAKSDAEARAKEAARPQFHLF